MMIAVMIPMNKAAMADGTLWPMAWNDDDDGGVFGPMDFLEIDEGVPLFPEDAAARAQEEIEGFFRIDHKRMVLETRSEAIVERVREMVRTRKDLQAAVYLVRGTEQGIEEERHDILPDGSIQPPLVLGRVSSTAPAICTGSTATWCPIHGDCTCPHLNDDPQEGRTLDDASCPLHAPASAHGEEEGREVGFELGEVDHHGELELILEVNGAKDSAWLSKEMWERMGEVAGWQEPPSVDIQKLERLISDAEDGVRDGEAAEQYWLASRLESCAEALREFLPLQRLVTELRRGRAEGEVAHPPLFSAVEKALVQTRVKAAVASRQQEAARDEELKMLRRTVNEGIEITHDQAAKIEQLEQLVTETNRLLNAFVVKRFVELRTAWYLATGHLSNPHKILADPSYREIVDLGWPVVPYLLGDLTGEDPCHFWAQALQEITGEQITIAKEDYGKSRIISAAWLELAKKKGWRVQSAS